MSEWSDMELLPLLIPVVVFVNVAGIACLIALGQHASRREWAFRTVCHECGTMETHKHLSDSQFWASVCPACGRMRRVERCRIHKREIETA